MLDSKKITDGAGELWSQNTSYSKLTKACIDGESIYLQVIKK